MTTNQKVIKALAIRTNKAKALLDNAQGDHPIRISTALKMYLAEKMKLKTAIGLRLN